MLLPLIVVGVVTSIVVAFALIDIENMSLEECGCELLRRGDNCPYRENGRYTRVCTMCPFFNVDYRE